MDYDNKNYMGSLIRAEGKTIILVNTDIKNVGRINFTKAHELGHFSLNHKGQQFECSRLDMLDTTRKPLEIEANQFAREFLLPEPMIRPISLTAPFDFETINSIRNNFMVSKLAAAFRILDFHVGSYAFVASKDGIMSNNLVGKIILRRVGVPTDTRSFVNACLNSNSRMNGYLSIDPNIWVAQNRTGTKISMKEYSRADKSSGSAMTLLKVDVL